MTNELFLDQPRHTGLEAKLAELVSPTLGDLGYELVRIAVLGRDQPTVQIMADRADGLQFTVGDCEAISHAVGAVLDVANPLPNAWTLEVSSAGIDRPLTRIKDWNNYMGHLARVEMEQPVEGRRRITGMVLGADADAARIRLDDGSIFTAPLDLIRRAKLVLTDALIDATAAPQPELAEIEEEISTPAAPKKAAKINKGADNARRRRAN